MVSVGNKSQRRSGDSIYRLPNDRAVTTTSRSILASRFSATEEVLMTNRRLSLDAVKLRSLPTWPNRFSAIVGGLSARTALSRQEQCGHWNDIWPRTA